ncbi:MAG: DNA polymerase III subunit gamma/tau, partial [Lachnospiraceae bacterium]
MSYTALYRKWRPPVFDDVKGQDPIVSALRNQIHTGRIGHAYLFCGTRGTGKTSVAKIFARAVNCEAPVNGNPCNQCSSCRAVNQGNSVNVMEIDAASNNGVDNIREIRDEVRYAPTEGRYKVYIIDEVHMLSTGAFNALLKTLEEPPAHVIFILATTEVHKIPVTVLSRCQRYDFRRISVDVIASRLKQLTDGEGVEIEDRALKYIARKADGSMRDSISLLDQCIAFHYGELLTYDKVLDVLGAASYDLFGNLLEAALDGRTADCIGLIDEIVMQGRELGQLVSDFIWYLRN